MAVCREQCSVTIRSAEHRIQGGVKFGQLKGSSSRYILRSQISSSVSSSSLVKTIYVRVDCYDQFHFKIHFNSEQVVSCDVVFPKKFDIAKLN